MSLCLVQQCDSSCMVCNQRHQFSFRFFSTESRYTLSIGASTSSKKPNYIVHTEIEGDLNMNWHELTALTTSQAYDQNKLSRKNQRTTGCNVVLTCTEKKIFISVTWTLSFSKISKIFHGCEFISSQLQVLKRLAAKIYSHSQDFLWDGILVPLILRNNVSPISVSYTYTTISIATIFF